MNVLIIGLGSIALKHIKALQEIDTHLTIFALRSSYASKSYQGVINIYGINELTEKPDFVIISNPTMLHGNAILKVLPLNCPLFIEKPVLAKPDKEVENEVLLKDQLLTYVACNLRFHPSILFLKNLILQNDVAINEVNVYCGSNLAEWRPAQDYTKTYSAHSELGGGVHLDLIHEIDYCYWLFGHPTDVISLKRKVSSLKINSFDFAAYHLNYPGYTINIVLNYYRHTKKREIEIVTERGEISVDLSASTVSLYGDEIITSPNFIMEETYTQQMEYFINHVKTGKQPMNSFKEALEVLKIATAS